MTEFDAHPPSRRLIAGAVGPERRPYRKHPDEPRWFEPLHVRAPDASREAMARAVASGADVLVAPTWLTHRRALLPVGETRRAAAWTAAAVRLAREAADRGMELRERAADEPATEDAGGASGARGKGVGGSRAGVPRDPVLLAGVLPSLGDAADTEAGRVAPRDAGVARDLQAQAGLLADADVDVLLVEGGPAVAGARVAADAAVATGLPTWMMAPLGAGRAPVLAGGELIDAWAGSMVHAGVAGFLVSPAPGSDVVAALGVLRGAGIRGERIGVLPMLRPVDASADGAGSDGAAQTGLRPEATRWLEAGAWLLGLGDGVTTERLTQLRAAIDAVDAARFADRAAARDAWVALVGEAARRAPGGRAAWVGPRGADVALPGGFAWTELPAEAIAALPLGEFRLVVAAAPLPGEQLAALLEPGGTLLARDAHPTAPVAAGLRLVDVHAGSPGAVLARRET